MNYLDCLEYPAIRFTVRLVGRFFLRTWTMRGTIRGLRGDYGA